MRRFLRWGAMGALLSGLLVVFGLPRAIDAQEAKSVAVAVKGGQADFVRLAPPADATPTRELPVPGVVTEGAVVVADAEQGRVEAGPREREERSASKEEQRPSKGLREVKRPGVGVTPVDVGGGPGSVFKVEKSKDKSRPGSASVSKLRFEVLDELTRGKVGASAFLFRVERTDGGKGSARAAVGIDLSSLTDLYGGDFVSRARLFRYPECVLTTPSKPECLPVPVDSSFGVSGRLEADLDVGDDVASVDAGLVEKYRGKGNGKAGPAVAVESAGVAGGRGFGVVLAQATGNHNGWLYGISGTSGSYGAAVLSGSGSGDGNANTGGFSWSYDVVVPPSAGGLVPQVSVSYSSQAVDAVSTHNSPQPCDLGLG